MPPTRRLCAPGATPRPPPAEPWRGPSAPPSSAAPLRLPGRPAPWCGVGRLRPLPLGGTKALDHPPFWPRQGGGLNPLSRPQGCPAVTVAPGPCPLSALAVGGGWGSTALPWPKGNGVAQPAPPPSCTGPAGAGGWGSTGSIHPKGVGGASPWPSRPDSGRPPASGPASSRSARPRASPCPPWPGRAPLVPTGLRATSPRNRESKAATGAETQCATPRIGSRGRKAEGNMPSAQAPRQGHWPA